MAMYKCKHCGAEAESKCAVNRQVRPLNQREAAWSYFFFGDHKVEETRHTFTITFVSHTDPDAKQPTTDQAVREQLITIGKYITEMLASDGKGTFAAPTPKQWLCHHEWTLVSDQCELGCCKRRRRRSKQTKSD